MKRKLSLFMVATLVLGSTNVVNASEFSDTTGHWAETAIKEWSDYDVVGGYTDGTFKPSAKITRAELSSLLYKVMKYQEVGINTFSDLKGNEWYAESILKNVNAGNLNGYEDGTVRANRNVTRQEVAVILCNAFDIKVEEGKTTFADDSSISEWSKGSVKALHEEGYIKGREGNIFAPKEEITRAEVVAMLDNIVANIYNNKGTYTVVSNGNVLVNTEDVMLKDTVVNGDIYVASGVNDGELTLDNVKVTGDIIVEGGGINSVKITNGSSANGVKVQKNSDSPVRVFLDSSSIVSHVDTSSKAGVKLEGEGNFGTVKINGTNSIEIANGTSVEKLEINGGGSLTNNGVIIEVLVNPEAANVSITGKGKVDTVISNSSSVTLDLDTAKVVLGNSNVNITITEKVKSVVDSNGNDAKTKVTIKDTTTNQNANGNNSSNNNSNNNNNNSDNDDIGSNHKDVTAPNITEIKITKLTSTDVEIKFTSNESGNYSFTTNDEEAGSGSLNVGENTIKISNLSPNKNYVVVLKPKDAEGNSKAYTIHFTTLVDDKDTVAPIISNMLVNDITSSSAILVFTSNESGTYSYNLNNGPNFNGILKLGENQVLMDNLEPNTAYNVNLQVKDIEENSNTYNKEFITEEDKKLNLVLNDSIEKKIQAGYINSIMTRSDGTVVSAGRDDYGQGDVDTWTDIAAVSSGWYHTLGLRNDGTVFATGSNVSGQCNVVEWSDIVEVSTGYQHSVGLKSDGTVVAVGSNDYGQCNVEGWRDIIAIAAGNYCTFGIKIDGTIVATGDNSSGQCDIEGWSKISSISNYGYYTIGLKYDGTVVVAGHYFSGNLDGWNDIVAVSAGNQHVVGLKRDGTVLSTGTVDAGQCNVEGWSDIIAISGGSRHTLGLKSDGTVLAVGDNRYGQCDIESWNYFNNN